MSNITWGLQRDITPRLGLALCRRGTGCIIWLTGPATPVNSVTPNAGNWMKLSTLYQPDGIDADLR